MKVTTRIAASADLETVLGFMPDYYRIEKLPYDRNHSEKSLRYLLKHPEYGSVWIVECDGAPAGYFCLAYNFSLDIGGRDCFLDEIYLTPDFRGKGVGNQVLRQIESYLNPLGFKGLHLLVFNFNKPAYRFYLRNGFEAQDGQFMTKSLGSGNSLI